MSIDTELAKAMIARADLDQLPADHELRTLAHAFDSACRGFYAEPQTHSTKQFMGCWARARRAWRNYIGEPLI